MFRFFFFFLFRNLSCTIVLRIVVIFSPSTSSCKDFYNASSFLTVVQINSLLLTQHYSTIINTDNIMLFMYLIYNNNVCYMSRSILSNFSLLIRID